MAVLVVVAGFLQIFLMCINTHVINDKAAIGLKQMASFLLVSLISIYLYGSIGVYASAFMLIGLFAVIAAFDRNFSDVLVALSASVILMLLSDPITATIETMLDVPTNSGFDVIYLISISILTVSGSLGLRALKRRFRWREKVDGRLKNTIAALGVITVIIYYLCIYLSAYIGETIELIQLNLFFFAIYLIISLVSLYVYAKSLRKSYAARQRESQFLLDAAVYGRVGAAVYRDPQVSARPSEYPFLIGRVRARR